MPIPTKYFRITLKGYIKPGKDGPFIQCKGYFDLSMNTWKLTWKEENDYYQVSNFRPHQIIEITKSTIEDYPDIKLKLSVKNDSQLKFYLIMSPKDRLALKWICVQKFLYDPQFPYIVLGSILAAIFTIILTKFFT